jgi:hypothetical protein
MYREEARGSLLPRLERDEGDQAEYLQSPKEHRCGEEPFFQTHQQVLIIDILHLSPLWTKAGLPFDGKSKGTTERLFTWVTHGAKRVLAYFNPLWPVS